MAQLGASLVEEDIKGTNSAASRKKGAKKP